jgi:hypothetical protein
MAVLGTEKKINKEQDTQQHKANDRIAIHSHYNSFLGSANIGYCPIAISHASAKPAPGRSGNQIHR